MWGQFPGFLLTLSSALTPTLWQWQLYLSSQPQPTLCLVQRPLSLSKKSAPSPELHLILCHHSLPFAASHDRTGQCKINQSVPRRADLGEHRNSTGHNFWQILVLSKQTGNVTRAPINFLKIFNDSEGLNEVFHSRGSSQ